MSEAAVTTAIEVDVEDVEVLSLLHGHDSHANDDISSGTVSLMTESSLRSTVPPDEDLSSVIADPRDERAVTALRQSDYHEGTVTTVESEPPGEDHDFISLEIPERLRRHVPPSSTNPSDIGEGTGKAISAPPSDIAMPSTSPQSICLCQAPTRIPRPRNAFILFRQHHHAAVVAQYPGKPNPEISKIIGTMWTGSSDDIKAIWNNHAEEEKKQHFQRYPQYRYQPRRNSKKPASASSSSTPASTIESALCPQCGGRTGAPSQTPSTRRTTTRAAKKQKAKHTSPESAGVEALLSLGVHSSPTPPPSSSTPKRRKLTTPSIISTPPSLLSNPYTVDPLLPSSNFTVRATAKSSIITRLAGIRKVCLPLTPIPRCPLIALDGPDPEHLTSLLAALTPLLAHHDTHTISIPDDLTILTDTFINGLLDPTTLPDPDADDVEAAKYLSHVGGWRKQAAEIRRFLCEERKMVIVNRYILSRSDAAAARLETGCLDAMEHWQWCAGVWRGCVGADLTVVVAEGEEVVGGVAAVGSGVVFVKRGVDGWGGKVLETLVKEVERVVAALKGLG